ncbi:MAG TPA: amidophosphoribosyltransferase [Syntrophales bacterium]|nr:amidophosphoribosyltransferase [Syntrophales bacterium]
MKEIEENCGLFGMISGNPCIMDIYQGIDFLQHRGQQYCGIATFDEAIRQVTHYGKVGITFQQQELSYLTGNRGIGHVSLWERQPVTLHSKLGEMAVAFSGNVVNSEKLLKSMKAKGKAFQRNEHIEIISHAIMEESDVVSGIASLARKIEGAYCIVVLTRDAVYAARDIYGFRPLILGRNGDRVAVSSESRALQNLDIDVVRDVRPGEIVRLSEAGFETALQLPSPRTAHCAFEWAYTASIDSIIDGIYVQEARSRLGESLAARDREEGNLAADIVAPVPMSGIGHALGYHKGSGIPYQEVFLYNRYADRSYTQSTQAAREVMAKRKLSVLRYAVQGKRIVLCDDSIVRGTQIQNKVRDIKKVGAREVHVRIACPPLMYPCDFGISTRSYDELCAREFLRKGDILSLQELRKLESWMAVRIGADSVKYNSIDLFVKALGLPRGALCLKCWDGASPIRNRKKGA